MEGQDLIKQALLEAMDEFHDFCEKNNLTYYLVGGGLIGAIRHKGFIPWDDDLDVMMPKKDYESLIALHSEFRHPLKIDHYSLSEKYYKCCTSLINKNVLVDNGRYENNITGVTVDVLCLYPTFKNKSLVKFHFKSVKFYRGLLIIKGKNYPRFKYTATINKILSVINRSLRPVPKSILTNLLNVFENIKVNIKVNDASHLANIHGAWGEKEVIDINMLVDRQLYDFEGRQYWSMSYRSAHNWLTNIYGDYMTLPPEKDRIYTHIDKIVKVNNDL